MKNTAMTDSAHSILHWLVEAIQQLIHSMKVLWHENFAVSQSTLNIREIKMPKNTEILLQQQNCSFWLLKTHKYGRNS